MKKSTIILVVVLALIILGGWYFYSVETASAPATPSEQVQNIQSSQSQPLAAPTSAAVTLTSAGFSPTVVTIAKGGTVTWRNETGGRMWIGSAMHPEHVAYDGTSKDEHCAVGYAGPVPFDQCSSGASYSFTFNQVGAWKYHNHSNESQFGTVIVD